jgi:N-acetylglucosamine kinase-like BadF-type ATPase
VAFYLGIDGGGSKTSCVIGNEDRVLATATGGASNITRVGEANARESLHQVICEACDAAGIKPAELERACIGAAGAAREEIAAVIRRIVAEVIPGELQVVGDMEIALQAAFGAAPGIVVIAGTGSIAYGRDADGRTARAGGWGFAISDEGSAHWIGRAAVAALLREQDVSPSHASAKSSALFREIEKIWKADSLPHLARIANSQPDFAALLPAVIAAADGDDALAKKILLAAGAELAQLAAIVVRRIFQPSHANAGPVPVAMIGGVFRHAALVREAFCGELAKLNFNLKINPEIVDPLQGALALARRSASAANL